MKITKLDLADAQFIGYTHGKDRGLLEMVISMGLKKNEWLVWKRDYPTSVLSDAEVSEIDEYFEKHLSI